MRDELAYIALKNRIILLSFLGPCLLIIARVSGADFWDGFAGGSYHNTGLQDMLITTGVWLPVLITIIMSVLCVRTARKLNHSDPRVMNKALPLAIFLPLPLSVSCFFFMMLLG